MKPRTTNKHSLTHQPILFTDTPMINWRRGAVWSLFLKLMLTLCWWALGMGEPLPFNLTNRTWIESVCKSSKTKTRQINVGNNELQSSTQTATAAAAQRTCDSKCFWDWSPWYLQWMRCAPSDVNSEYVTWTVLLLLTRGHANIYLVMSVVKLSVNTIRGNGMIGMLFPGMYGIIGTIVVSIGVLESSGVSLWCVLFCCWDHSIFRHLLVASNPSITGIWMSISTTSNKSALLFINYMFFLLLLCWAIPPPRLKGFKLSVCVWVSK